MLWVLVVPGWFHSVGRAVAVRPSCVLKTSVAGGASVRPTWTPPGCDWCLWHLLLSYGVPVQLGSVPSGCCGCWLCLGGSVVSAGPLPSDPVVCLKTSVAGGASVRSTWTPPGCDWCLWHLLLSYGVPVQLGSVPSRCCGCWLCLGGSVVSAGPLPSDPVVCLMSSVAGGASVRPTWASPGCDWCLWHLLLSYSMPVQLGSVPSRCCGCWLCQGGSGSVGRAVAIPPYCVHKVSVWPVISRPVAGNVVSLGAHSESC